MHTVPLSFRADQVTLPRDLANVNRAASALFRAREVDFRLCTARTARLSTTRSHAHKDRSGAVDALEYAHRAGCAAARTCAGARCRDARGAPLTPLLRLNAGRPGGIGRCTSADPTQTQYSHAHLPFLTLVLGSSLHTTLDLLRLPPACHPAIVHRLLHVLDQLAEAIDRRRVLLEADSERRRRLADAVEEGLDEVRREVRRCERRRGLGLGEAEDVRRRAKEVRWARTS